MMIFTQLRLQPELLGCACRVGFVVFFFSLFFSGERVGANTSILSNYIIERECISFLHLMASNISPNSLKLRNTLSFNFSYHFHFFSCFLIFFLCSHQHSLPLNSPKETVDMFLLLFLCDLLYLTVFIFFPPKIKHHSLGVPDFSFLRISEQYTL